MDWRFAALAWDWLPDWFIPSIVVGIVIVVCILLVAPNDKLDGM